VNNNITILPVRANDSFPGSGAWTDVIFWKEYDMQPGYPKEWDKNSPVQKPVARWINLIYLVQHKHAERKTIFACTLYYKFSIN
jgi:hypothetical protein